MWKPASGNNLIFSIAGEEVSDHPIVPYYVNSAEDDTSLYQPWLTFSSG